MHYRLKWLRIPILATLVFAVIGTACAADEPGLLDFSSASVAYGYSFADHEDLTIGKASFHVNSWTLGANKLTVTGDVLAVGEDPLNFSFGTTKLGIGASLSLADPGKSFGLGVGYVQEKGLIVYATLLKTNF